MAEEQGYEPSATIRLLIEGQEAATKDVIGKIIALVAEAPFARRPVSVPDQLRGKAYLGHQFGTRAPSDVVHLVKRIIIEEQWKPGTTLDEYEQDLRNAIRQKDARAVIYHSRGSYYLAVLSPNRVPEARLGNAPDKHIWVVYDVDRGTIVTGYQIPGIEAVRLPKDARWLE